MFINVNLTPSKRGSVSRITRELIRTQYLGYKSMMSSRLKIFINTACVPRVSKGMAKKVRRMWLCGNGIKHPNLQPQTYSLFEEQI